MRDDTERSERGGPARPTGQGARGRADSDVPTIAIPTLGLPKGGGALTSVGEKFSANAATGAASLQIPIYTSPARDGMEPTLGLAYNSGAGNGPFGLGFSLSLPGVARRTEKRLPRYDDDDAFILSGAEELVRSRFYGIWNEGARTDGNFVVTCYQPRVDALFARIERWTDSTSGDFFWRAFTHDNLLHVYGRSPTARIADPDDPRRVFRWLLESTSDGKGNQIVYHYRAEDGTGVPDAIYEARRRGTNVYLDRILYGNRRSTLGEAPPRADQPEDWLFEVVLDYGERAGQILPTLPTYVPPAAWTVRRDPFSTFKPGFELRTQRLCRRVLMFHRVADPALPQLVRSTDFSYDERESFTFLSGVTQTGYDAAASPPFVQLPAAALSYSSAQPEAQVRDLDSGSLHNLPRGLDGDRYRWLDLDSEGLAGVLSEQPTGWFYKRNEGGGRLGAAALVVKQPSGAGLADGQQLVDLERDGHKYLVRWNGPAAGAQPRQADGGWGAFHAFTSRPTADVDDPNVRLIDLDGDGRADLLVTEDRVLRWHPSLGRDGFGAPSWLGKPAHEDRGPALLFADASESIHLADMSGDGLTDIVRVRNGEISYWPNLGYGRFGARIAMANAPRFDHDDLFDQRRVRLADIDGDGAADLVYLDGDGARYWMNCAGNGFGVGQRLVGFPGYDNVTSVDAIDLLGNGTACLVWSSPLPGRMGRALRYVELTGGIKPYLLTGIDSGRGMKTAITWAASTEFYVADRAAGTPWATRIPFPVHVVKQVDVSDAVSGNALTRRYAYHHGFYDGVEWEFRGFGMVEQWDAESFDPSQAVGGGDAGEGGVLRVPPIHTKTWFHTGAFLEDASLSQRFATEYFRVDGVLELALPDPVLEDVTSSRDARQAMRALAGQVLRQEIYADDDAVDAQGNALAAIPFVITAHNHHVKALQPATESQYGIFITRALETLTCLLERDPSDPRLSHDVVLGADDHGNYTDVVAIAYPRRPDKLEGIAGQDGVLAVHRHEDVTNVVGELDWYRVGARIETRSFEVAGFEHAPIVPAPLTATAPAYALDVIAQAPAAAVIAYEAAFSPGAFQRRLLSDVQLFYRGDDGQTELPFGQVAARGLRSRTRRMAFSQALLDATFDVDHALPPGIVTAGGYDLDGTDYWARSPSAVYAASRFYQPSGFSDAFGNVTTPGYDPVALHVTSLTDAVGNVVTATFDARTLQPLAVVDANGNQSLAAYDALGRIVATAVQGKTPAADQPPAEGDTIDSPTTRTTYRLDTIPNYVVHQARENHQYPDHVGEAPAWRYSYCYYDGFGREVMRKVEDDDGQPATQASTRWVGTGRTIFNNKGNPVKKYEPYFSGTSDFESEASLTQSGVTDVLRYDALDRVVRVDHPSGTFSLVTFDVWTQKGYDENDTLAGHGFNAWWTRFGVTPPTTPQEVAAVAAYEHRDTPALSKVDVLGRTVETRLTNVEYPGGARTLVEYPSRSTIDIQGNVKAIVLTNQRGGGPVVDVTLLTQVFDMLGRPLFRQSCDAGAAWTLADAADQPLFSHDGRASTSPPTPTTSGFVVTWTRDALRRPLSRLVRAPGQSSDAVAEVYQYGEGLSGLTDENGAPATPQSLNLLGRAYRHRDGAGVITNVRYDFKGGVLFQSRQLRSDYTTELVDWSAPVVNGVDPNALDATVYMTASTFDALGRVVTLEQPDGDRTQQIAGTRIAHGFGKRSTLRTVTVTPTGATQAQLLVSDVTYNERGQRKQIRYGNGVVTTYGYEPDTFRLSTLDTRDAQGNALQGFAYVYDPVGNIAQIDDAATPTVTYNGGAVSSGQSCAYDAIYRLLQATGREHIAQTSTQDQTFGYNLPAATQADAFRRYTETYGYDRSGNFVTMQHRASVGGGAIENWTRLYETDANSNRLLSTSQDASEAGPHYSLQYLYDGAGNMTRMPQLGGVAGAANCIWNDKNQLASVLLNAAVDAADATDRAYYCYDGSGQRMRKVVVAAGNIKRERIYLGSCEIHRHMGAAGLTERRAVHVMDDRRRIAVVERKTKDAGVVVSAGPVLRYQLGNHLGSSLLELDANGRQISREEYHPFGTTSYYSGPSAQLDVDIKRYRYTSCERDDESGLYYHGARYYAAWLGRWVSCDPIGIAGGLDLYRYANDNPVGASDTSGTDPKCTPVKPPDPPPPDTKKKDDKAEEPPPQVDTAERRVYRKVGEAGDEPDKDKQIPANCIGYDEVALGSGSFRHYVLKRPVPTLWGNWTNSAPLIPQGFWVGELAPAGTLAPALGQKSAGLTFGGRGRIAGTKLELGPIVTFTAADPSDQSSAGAGVVAREQVYASDPKEGKDPTDVRSLMEQVTISPHQRGPNPGGQVSYLASNSDTNVDRNWVLGYSLYGSVVRNDVKHLTSIIYQQQKTWPIGDHGRTQFAIEFMAGTLVGGDGQLRVGLRGGMALGILHASEPYLTSAGRLKGYDAWSIYAGVLTDTDVTSSGLPTSPAIGIIFNLGAMRLYEQPRP